MVSVWDEILNRVETKVNRHSFYTWFRPTSFLKDSGEIITIRVPNPLFKDWLRKHYSGVLSEALADIERGDTELEFVTEDAIAPTEGTPATSPAPEVATGITPAGLNLQYSFDSFIVGPSNQFAHAACRAVAEAPSRSYNPLFIFGGVGLGKTHLKHAIGQYVLRKNPSLRLTYILKSSTPKFFILTLVT